MDSNKRERLESIGINLDEALERFSNVEELYERFLKKFPNDPNFEQLKDNLASHNFEDAFRACHTMKGVVGNLSIIPLYNIVYDETELLRNGTDVDGAVANFSKVEEEYNNVVAALREIYSL